ncbi:putative transaldolase [Kaistia sp. 32K]|uniref:transaldolase family protein n=1 Tax=Kaistia sp. 32K TaxID=2795690 RepID=UPI0019169C9B|nr:transaldolase family protein [Kaistia sp. 32K]BCP51674.1 putative transaldolase [Kaistia sp. 32K]
MTELKRPRLFLDTADRAAWDAWLPTGLFHGITTNPTLLAAAGVPNSLAELKGLSTFAFASGVQEFQAQTWGRTSEALTANGRRIAELDARIVVKVPITREGAIAAAVLKAEGVRITMTAVYAAHQAVTAAALGADYVAPYLGRMNDAGRDGFAEIAAMQEIARGAGSPMRVLVASVRSSDDLVRLGRLGVDTFTFSPAVAAALFAEALTDAAAEAFERAAEG